ncbi:MAG: lipopolysaccharide biosynthesis protein [Gammaproteobacteria bacterium]|nr:MAG: lipopolysaccharide biosynthesis protein [Gammaproteobacteria bacterium]
MNIKAQLGKSTAWMSLAASGNSAISFVIFIVLSRLLSPAEIGLVAFALIIVELGKIIVNGGFAQAVVQKADWDNKYASTCFYLNLFFSLVVALIVLGIVSPLVIRYYQPEAGTILNVFSIMFFLEGTKAVHEGKLKREFAFKIIAIRTVLAGLIPGAVGIFLAYRGYGVWALVAQQMLNQVVVTILTLSTAKWMPTLAFSKEHAQQILNFSIPLMLAQFISNASSKIFELMIGIMIGPAALGLYRVGGRALYILQDVLLKPFEHTALSALARVDGTANQGRATVRMIRMSAFLIFPLFFGAAAVAPEFITFAFGVKWEESGIIMTILSFGIAPYVLGLHINAALTASGNSGMVMTIAIVSFIINCVLGFIFVPFGLIVAAWTFSIRGFIINSMGIFWFKKAFNVPIVDIPKAVAPSFISSLLMFLAVYFATPILADRIPTLLNIIVLCALGGVIYTFLMLVIFRSATSFVFKEAEQIAPQKFKPILISLKKVMRLN